MPRRYTQLIFDLDGTLIDSLADIAAAVNYVRANHGLPPLSAEIIRGYVGDGARALIERALGPEPQPSVDEALRTYLDYYAEHCLQETTAYPGIDGALAALAARGVVLSVLTNKPEATSRAILDGLGLLPHFAAVLGGDSLPARKPDPAGVERLRTAARTARERVVVVGDSLVDARTAVAAEVAFCGVAWGFGSVALADASIKPIIDTPAELVTLAGDE